MDSAKKKNIMQPIRDHLQKATARDLGAPTPQLMVKMTSTYYKKVCQAVGWDPKLMAKSTVKGWLYGFQVVIDDNLDTDFQVVEKAPAYQPNIVKEQEND